MTLLCLNWSLHSTEIWEWHFQVLGNRRDLTLQIRDNVGEKGGSSQAKTPFEPGLSGVEVFMPKGAQGPERSSRFVSSPQGTHDAKMPADLCVPEVMAGQASWRQQKTFCDSDERQDQQGGPLKLVHGGLAVTCPSFPNAGVHHQHLLLPSCASHVGSTVADTCPLPSAEVMGTLCSAINTL